MNVISSQDIFLRKMLRPVKDYSHYSLGLSPSTILHSRIGNSFDDFREPVNQSRQHSPYKDQQRERE